MRRSVLLCLVAACGAPTEPATVNVEGNGRIWSTDARVDCAAGACRIRATNGPARVFAAAGAGARLVTWTGACAGAEVYCDVASGESAGVRFADTPCLYDEPRATTGIVLYGQSLAFGIRGAPALSTSAAFPEDALILDVAGEALCPAAERSRCGPWPDVESPRTALVSSWRERRGSGRFVLVTGGAGGTPIADLSKGSAHYASLLERVARANELAGDLVVRGVAFVHGPSDEANDGYAEALRALASDLDEDIRATTKQRSSVRMFVDQTSAWTRGANVRPPNVALEQLRACLEDPRIDCIGPQYDLLHAQDRLHLVAGSYRTLGERFANAMYDRVETCRPVDAPFIESAVGDRTKIVVRYRVNEPPLRFDTRGCPRHPSFGFELEDDDGHSFDLRRLTVTSPHEVTIETAVDPCGRDLTLSYAASGAPGGGGGCQNDGPKAPYGNLRAARWALTQAVPVLCGAR